MGRCVWPLYAGSCRLWVALPYPRWTGCGRCLRLVRWCCWGWFGSGWRRARGACRVWHDLRRWGLGRLVDRWVRQRRGLRMVLRQWARLPLRLLGMLLLCLLLLLRLLMLPVLWVLLLVVRRRALVVGPGVVVWGSGSPEGGRRIWPGDRRVCRMSAAAVAGAARAPRCRRGPVGVSERRQAAGSWSGAAESSCGMPVAPGCRSSAAAAAAAAAAGSTAGAADLGAAW